MADLKARHPFFTEPVKKPDSGGASRAPAAAGAGADRPSLPTGSGGSDAWDGERLRRIRAGLDNMSQADFAETFHIPLRTLCEWEQDKRTPNAPSATLLTLIERDPKSIQRMLKSGGKR